MSNNEPAAESTESQPRSEAWKTALTVLQSVKPPSIPDGAEAMTVVIEFPPGDPGTLRTGTRDPLSATRWRERCSSSWKASPSG